MADARLLPVADGRTVAARLWRMLRGRRLALVGILVLFVIEAATALVFPLVIGSLVDTVIAADRTQLPTEFWWQAGALVGAAIVAGIVTWVAAVALARLAETVI